ncbi:MAG: glutamine amidotransferase [Actinomycetes bacterium]
MSQIKIVRIHNELLGTYGDQGNAEVLEFRAKFHGITANIVDVSYNDDLPTNGGIYLLGGAEDAAQLLSLEALRRGDNLNILHLAIERGAVILAVCAGFQIIGNKFFASGQEIDGLGLLDVSSVPGDKRMVGDIKIISSVLGLEITGFENHMGRTILGPSVQAFGKVSIGHGNGDDKYDGAVNGNIFGTYIHGPILARNPEFADLLLTRATGRKYAQITDPLALKYATWRRKVI